MRKMLVGSVLLVLLNVQGCASSFDSFVAGALIGGAVAGCSRYCY